jgi:hypothetical protein
MSGTGEQDDTAPNPLDIERARQDIKVAYARDWIAAAVVLRRTDSGAYVELRNQLKEIPGFSAKQYDEDIDAEARRTSPFEMDAADDIVLLTDIASGWSYFVDANNDDAVFAELPDSRCHGIAVSIHTRQFRRALINKFMALRRRAPGRDALKIAVDGVDAKAIKDSESHPVFVRVAYLDGAVYIDRGVPEGGSFIKITAAGREIVTETPAKFIRPAKGMGVLPIPKRGGRISNFKKHLNVMGDRDFWLVVDWILGCLRPIGAGAGAGEYALMLLLGPHGTSKTTAMKFAFALVDPIRTEPIGPPREDRDVLVIARETFALGIDNVKHIAIERSAVYCRLLSGASNTGRALYTDMETASITARRPIAMTSTTMVVTEEDLSDRTLLIRMGPTFEGQIGKRKTSARIDAEFRAELPLFFGCILDAVEAGLRNAHLPEPPLTRLADMAFWLHRCEPGFAKEDCPPGSLLGALHESIQEMAQDIADHDPTASAIVAFMAEGSKQTSGKQLVSQLWGTLRTQNRNKGLHAKDFPGSPNAFSRRVRELQVVLHRNQLHVTLHREAAGSMIEITRIVRTPQPNGADEVSEPAAETATGKPEEAARP